MDWVKLALAPETGLRAVMALLGAKVALGALAAIVRRQFNWRRLADFVLDDVVAFGGGLLILWLLSLLDPVIAPMFTAASAAVSAMLVRQCWTHVKGLFGADPG